MTAQARQQRLTLFMLTATSVLLVLRDATGIQDLGLLVPYSRRNQAWTADTIGFFNSLMLLRVRAPAGADFDHIAREVRRVTLQGLRHGAIDFYTLMQHFHLGHYGRQPTDPYLFLNVAGTPEAPRLSGITTEFVWPERPGVYEQYTGITIALDHEPTHARLSCGFQSTVYDEETIAHIMNRVGQLMTGTVLTW
jgi:non-ribosomal peptide synthetase component F